MLSFLFNQAAFRDAASFNLIIEEFNLIILEKNDQIESFFFRIVELRLI